MVLYGSPPCFFTWTFDSFLHMRSAEILLTFPHPVILSENDLGVQSPPKRIVFWFYSHYQKVIGSVRLLTKCRIYNEKFWDHRDACSSLSLLNMSWCFLRPFYGYNKAMFRIQFMEYKIQTHHYLVGRQLMVSFTSMDQLTIQQDCLGN